MATKVRGENRETMLLSLDALPLDPNGNVNSNGHQNGQAEPAVPERKTTGNLSDNPYLNRELSWIEFNSRVLDEALDPTQPLLERLKFLSIFSTNLDEFFMVRVSGLQEQAEANPALVSPDGLTPGLQLRKIE